MSQTFGWFTPATNPHPATPARPTPPSGDSPIYAALAAQYLTDAAPEGPVWPTTEQAARAGARIAAAFGQRPTRHPSRAATAPPPNPFGDAPPPDIRP